MIDVYAREPEPELFRESLRDFLAQEILPHIDAWETAGEIPRWVWRKFGEMGYFGLNFPEAYGGQDLDFWYQVIFIEELSRCNSAGFAAAMIAHPILALTHINASGSDFLKEKYLISGINGELFGALAITEPGAGSDVANLQTKAVKQGDYYQIDGSKTFITNGVLSDFIVTAVKTENQMGAGGISLIVVDRGTPGLSAQKLHKLGWHASDTGLIAFDEVRVPAEQLIGQAGMGFYYIMQRFALERLVMAISGVAAAEDALEYTLQYMAERQAFGRPINKFQVLRHRMAQLAAEISRAKVFNYTLAQAYNDGAYQVKECAMAKLLATQLSDKVMTECLQAFGGYGYMEDYKIARMFRDSRIGTIGGGSSEIMCEIIAKAVMG
jgi:alkylation response protein AidB-like acyl-CoA dehydrogenase